MLSTDCGKQDIWYLVLSQFFFLVFFSLEKFGFTFNGTFTSWTGMNKSFPLVFSGFSLSNISIRKYLSSKSIMHNLCSSESAKMHLQSANIRHCRIRIFSNCRQAEWKKGCFFFSRLLYCSLLTLSIQSIVAAVPFTKLLCTYSYVYCIYSCSIRVFSDLIGFYLNVRRDI